MTNNKNSLNGALMELSELMATNLKSKGIKNAKASDGLTTLANKISNIYLIDDLNTSLELSYVGDGTYYVNDSVTLLGKLNAFFDDVSLNDIDLVDGYLKGATIKFMDGNIVLGSAITNNEGIATAEFQFPMSGIHNIKAVFEGTEDYKNSESSITISIEEHSTDITFTGENISLGYRNYEWLKTDGDVIISWGDGTIDTVNNPSTVLGHTYSDGLSEHTIKFIGTVNELGYYCFTGCTGLISIDISDTVTKINDSCFNGCTNLNSIIIPDTITSFGWQSFRGCSSLTSIHIPSSMTTLGDSCFWGCTNLTSVDIHDNITSFAGHVFYNCTSLTSIYIPKNITSIGAYCFYYSGLTSIDIPKTITRIENSTFFGCNGLTQIEIPPNITYLGQVCFQMCDNLTSVSIPNSVKTMEMQTFGFCSNILDYQLYWEGDDIIEYDTYKFYGHANVIYTIPKGEKDNYIAKSFPSNKLVERE